MKKLSGKDVMVGDFVQRPGYGIGVVFECSNTHLLVDFNGKSEHLEWCEGVPLVSNERLIEHLRDMYNIPWANYQYTKRGYSEEEWYSFTINSINQIVDVLGIFNYAHELQHALSTAGYSPLIDTETYSYVDNMDK